MFYSGHKSRGDCLEQKVFRLHDFCRQNACPESLLDVRRLLAHVERVQVSEIGLERLLSLDAYFTFLRLFERYKMGEPLAYVMGEWGFWGLDLEVGPGVLVPRQDTECLVEVVLSRLAQKHGVRVLDLGTGSGAIALALAKERPDWSIVGIELDSRAYAFALRNHERHARIAKNIVFRQQDWSCLNDKEQWDLWVSNPPYIDPSDEHLANSVRVWEPEEALFAEAGGLFCIQAIVRLSQKYLKSGGVLVLEHGWRQAGAVSEILERAGYGEIVITKDDAGHQRVTSAVRKG